MTPSHPVPTAIALDVLGAIDLRREGEQLADVLAQPKRFGLLIYLVLRRPGEFISRDELVGVFWPESTERRARASLRQALRFLRSHLGQGVIVNRGDAEVRVAPGTVSCDAVAVLRALDAGDDRAAVDRYGGELLPGFLLAGVYGFDRWLQAERQKLRAAAIRAALRAAGAAEARGDLAGACERTRWALGLQPTDEAVARRLISLLARAGNRAGAVVAYEALESRLAEELELEPSPETVELIETVRSAAGKAGAPGRTGGAPPFSPQRVLVLGLENPAGDERLKAVGRLAADAVAQGLATIPELEVVPPMALGEGGTGGGGADPPERGERGLPADLVELARRTGAGTVVGGACYLDGDRLHLRARITDVVNGRLLEAPEPVAGSASSPLGAVEELRDRIMTVLAPTLTRRAVHVRKAARPPSIEAYTAYLEGLEHFIRGEWETALGRFRESVSLEPGYALPRIVWAITLWNLGALAEARATAREAAELGESLGRFERAVLDTVLAWLDGDWAAAHRAARVQAELAPGSIPHFQVAEEARRLNRPREAREVLSALDPEEGELRGWIFYWIELTAAHHLMGDHTRELELASRCRRLHPDDPVATLLEIRALAALGRPADVAHLLDQALAVPGAREPTPGALLREAALELMAHGRPDAADPLLERAVAWYEERVEHDDAEALRRDLARTLYHGGRLEDARQIFADLAGNGDGGIRAVGHHHGQLQAHLDQGYLAVIAAGRGDRQEADRWCRKLEALDGPFLYGAQWFWLAAVAALHGDPDGAVSLLRRAFADGLPHELFIHTDPHLRRLRGHQGFDALMRPRG